MHDPVTSVIRIADEPQPPVRSPRGRTPALVLAGVLVTIALAFAPRFTSVTTIAEVDASPPEIMPRRPPFGRSMEGALAYLGADRVLTLVELASGEIVGSKGIGNDRRPAAVSHTEVFLGRLPAGFDGGNWDSWRSLPWAGTQYQDRASGSWLAFSPELDVIAAAMRPLSSGNNGVVLVAQDGIREAATSAGMWSFTTWVGEEVLIREAIGSEVRWWLLSADGEAAPRPADLPLALRPIAGTSGLVMGELEGEAVIIDLDDGGISQLAAEWSWAADWRTEDEPILATVGGDPPALHAYHADGTLAWSRPLGDGATRFHGGVAWSPDGAFVVAPGGGSIQAFSASGSPLGGLDAGLPQPGIGDAGFVEVVTSTS